MVDTLPNSARKTRTERWSRAPFQVSISAFNEPFHMLSLRRTTGECGRIIRYHVKTVPYSQHEAPFERLRRWHGYPEALQTLRWALKRRLLERALADFRQAC